MDNGWEIPPVLLPDGWLRCASSRVLDVVWIGTEGERPLLACSRSLLFTELSQTWSASSASGPGAGSVMLPDWQSLDAVLRRASQLVSSLPNHIAHEFRTLTQSLPKSTEAERLVVQRVGQQLFRNGLLDYWNGQCAATRLAVPELLLASHIKPWASCDSDDERLDVFNGLLLAPHIDALFDGGWLTFGGDGAAEWSPHMPPEAYVPLGLSGMTLRINNLRPSHHKYLAAHRKLVWRK